MHIFNDNAMMHYTKILQIRQKQLTLDKFLVKKAWTATAEEEESKGSTRHGREKMSKGELPSLSIEGDSPSKQ